MGGAIWLVTCRLIPCNGMGNAGRPGAARYLLFSASIVTQRPGGAWNPAPIHSYDLARAYSRRNLDMMSGPDDAAGG